MKATRLIHHALPLITFALVAGCGGGGPAGVLTGVVTDIDGAQVAGATVAVGSETTTSLSNGTFQLKGVAQGIRTAVAAININGHRWSGQSDVDLLGNEQNRGLNIVISDERFQGAIAGTVINPSGFPLVGAKVFIGGPVSSTLAITDHDGNYRAPRLESGVTYTVTASLAGFINDTKQVTVDANQTSAASFALQVGSSQGTLPAPQNLIAQSWTVADHVTRSPNTQHPTPNTGKGAYDYLKHLYRQKRGLPDSPQARNITWKTATSRATPNGSVMEVDLFWDYQAFNDLFGYLIRRGANGAPLVDIAVARDPLTRTFFDVDPALTPDVPYDYIVHRLDTIDFPANGAVGQPSQSVRNTPLGPTHAISPVNGGVSSTPTFSWTSVNRAAIYTVYLWDKFPDLQNANDPNGNGVAPIWQMDSTTTSLPYTGPALQSSHTYYWIAVAADAASNPSSLSATEISKFVTP